MNCDRKAELSLSPVDSYLNSKTRIRISDFKVAKGKKEKWAMLTSYDFVSAKIFDSAKIPCLLIGDSASQTVFGYKSTLPVTVDELIPLARAVTLGCERALAIVDLPFGSYQESPEACLRSATRFMKESLVHGVKLEGGKEYAQHVQLLTKSGIPVMAHIGFTPQSEHSLSGYKIQGRSASQAESLLEDALALQDAGAFACVLELVPAAVGKLITARLEIPTVGIGAGPDCDAQILVWHDMAGFRAPVGKVAGYLSEDENEGSNTNQTVLQLNKLPKFVKSYSNFSELLYASAVRYSSDVNKGIFPAKEHCYD